MKKSFFAKITNIRFLLTSLAVLSGCMAFIFLQVHWLNSRTFGYEQNTKVLKQHIQKQNVVTVGVSIPSDKLWEEKDGSYGAQYDFTVYNNTDQVFTNWKIIADCVPGFRVDSLWSGKYSFEYSNEMKVPFGKFSAKEFGEQHLGEKDRIIVTPPNDNYNQVVPAGQAITFGMIMYVPNGFVPDNFILSGVKITGKHVYKVRHLKTFWTVVFLIVLNLALLVITAATEFAVRRKMFEYEQRRRYYHEVIIQSFKTFANFVDAKDPYTRGHSSRVGTYAREMARRLGMTEDEQENLFWEGLMHDVGKITIKDEILKKPGKLTDSEFDAIKSHTTNGFKLLRDFSAMQDLKEIALSHHERFDGTGYPNHLAGEKIPFEARIIGVCDAFDAMNSDRCYRPRLPKEKIISELRRGENGQFDPKLTEVMIQMIQDGFTDKIDKNQNVNI